MNIKTRDKWVKALRSGKYRQGIGNLGLRPGKGKKASYCCLGVLASLESKQLGTKWDKNEVVVEGYSGYLPDFALNALGLEFDVMTSLAASNDSGVPFETIADMIEENVRLT